MPIFPTVPYTCPECGASAERYVSSDSTLDDSKADIFCYTCKTYSTVLRKSDEGAETLREETDFQTWCDRQADSRQKKSEKVSEIA